MRPSARRACGKPRRRPYAPSRGPATEVTTVSMPAGTMNSVPSEVFNRGWAAQRNSNGRGESGFEAFELYDGGTRFRGRGVLKAVEHVDSVTAPVLLGRDVRINGQSMTCSSSWTERATSAGGAATRCSVFPWPGLPFLLFVSGADGV